MIKVPSDHVLQHPVWSKKFEREARILANIHHPNVVKIIAFWSQLTVGQSVLQALVQELVEGAKHLTEFAAANRDALPSLLLQSLYALRAFHDEASPAAVHRDLSPSNLLVSDIGVLKVIDFGLAKEDPRVTEILTVTNDWFGTAGCMSPEQLKDPASVDHRADLYALGRSFAAAIQQRSPQVVQLEKLAEPWKRICVHLTEYEASERPESAQV